MADTINFKNKMGQKGQVSLDKLLHRKLKIVQHDRIKRKCIYFIINNRCNNIFGFEMNI